MTQTDTLPPPVPDSKPAGGGVTALWVALGLVGLIGVGIGLLAGGFLLIRVGSRTTQDSPESVATEMSIELGDGGAQCAHTAPNGVAGSLCFIAGPDGVTLDAIGFAPASPLSVSSDSGGSIDLIIGGDGTLHTELSKQLVESRFMAHGILNNNARFTVVVDRIG